MRRRPKQLQMFQEHRMPVGEAIDLTVASLTEGVDLFAALEQS